MASMSGLVPGQYFHMGSFQSHMADSVSWLFSEQDPTAVSKIIRLTPWKLRMPLDCQPAKPPWGESHYLESSAEALVSTLSWQKTMP